MNVINPATEEIVAEISADDRDTLHTKLKKLREGQKLWRQKSVSDRLACIVRFGELMQENINEVVAILTSETGKPLLQSLNEIGGAQNRVEYGVGSKAVRRCSFASDH